MIVDVRCPRCGQDAEEGSGCRHLRWAPERGGPIEFAKSVLVSSPCTKGSGFEAASIRREWWESHHEWLLERIMARLDVADGYCFGDPVEIDRLCLDIWHRFAPEPERAAPPREPEAAGL